jgi:hypothetical protein
LFFLLFIKDGEGFAGESEIICVPQVKNIPELITGKAIKFGVVGIKFSFKDDTATLFLLKGWSEILCRK